MALFHKLFTKRKLENGNHEARKRDRPHQITQEQVRLLLFKECDWRGRKLIFDSSTISKVPATKHDKSNRQTDEVPCIVEVSDGFSYMYKGPAADASVLGEMIFGAVAMNYKGVSLKIHFMDEPKRLMCTKVFCVPTSRRISRVEKKGDVASSGDVRDCSKPLSVPAFREEGVSLSFSMDRGDSGFCSDQSPYSSVGSTYDYFSMFDIWDENNSQEDLFFHSPPGRKLSTSSNGSWQRRTFQNIATRFELGHQPSSSSNLLNVPTATSMGTSDSQIYSNSSTSGTNDSLCSSMVNLPQRKNKLGLAILITVSDHDEMDEVRKCVEHSPQLQALVCRLKLATLTAGTGNNFVSTLHKASTDAARWLSDLLYGPRVQPAWLSLVRSSRVAAVNMADSILADICSVLSVADTKHTNFFMSTLLTHVLTYHLGWVTTVSPYDTLDPQKEAPLVADARRPYNALWAQLNDLYGTIGFPPRSARTILSGTNDTQLLNRLLFVLTYFVRSGDIKRTDFQYRHSPVKEIKAVSLKNQPSGLRRTTTVTGLATGRLKVPEINSNGSDDSVSTLTSDTSMKRSATLASLNGKLSSAEPDSSSSSVGPALKRTLTALQPLKAISNSSLSSADSESDKVVFVLGDDEKLVGLHKSADGRSGKRTVKSTDESKQTVKSTDESERTVKSLDESKRTVKSTDECKQTVKSTDESKRTVRSTDESKRTVKSTDESKWTVKSTDESKRTVKPTDESKRTVESTDESKRTVKSTDECKRTVKPADESKPKDQCTDTSSSPSKCCSQTLQHSKPIKHSGIKFEFEKYPQIVTNYMKSKNLEILDRHYIGKPGNLKLASLQFDPTVVPPIQEERCEICYKCQQLEAMLQTPTNASEMEYMNDMPRHAEPQFAKESVVDTSQDHREVTPKTFVRKRKENTIVVNVNRLLESPPIVSVEAPRESRREKESEKEREKEKERERVREPCVQVKRVVEFPMPNMCSTNSCQSNTGFDSTLLGGVTDHYVPDLILQGTNAKPDTWELELRRDLELSTYLNKGLDPPVQTVAIIGDINSWEVRVVCRERGERGERGERTAGGMSALVGGMLDALPAMRQARVPAGQCLSFLEGKLREFCVLSKTLADMLMTTDFCDIATLTKSLNIDVNDVPLLLAVATTHTPQVATRYGISYR